MTLSEFLDSSLKINKSIGLVLALIIVLMPGLVQGQSFSFTGEASESEVLLGEYFEVVFKIGDAKAENFTPPSFAGFTVVDGPNRASSTTIVNGSISRSSSYSFTLEPLRTGKFTISPAFVFVDGKKIATKPIPIDVVTKRQINTTLSDREGQEVFVQAELSSNIAYPGQQITLEYVVYTRKKVISANFKSIPELDGIYAREFKNYDAGEKTKSINGKKYKAKAIKKLALFPQKTGKFQIDPAAISLGIPFEDEDIFGSLLGGSSKPKLVQSNPLTLEVIPLPVPMPTDFSGAVGRFEYEVSSDKNNISTDDAAMLNFKIWGNGDIKLVQPPKVQSDSLFDCYPPELLDDLDEESRQSIISTRNYIVDVTPKKAGNYNLQAPPFTYFDLESKSYKTIRPDPLKFIVSQGAGVSLNTEAENESLEQKPDKSNNFFDTYKTPILAGGISLVLLALIGFYFRKKPQPQIIDPETAPVKDLEVIQNDDETEAKRKKIGWLRLVSDAEYLLKENQILSSYRKLNEALTAYFSDKYNIPVSSYSIQKLHDEFKSSKLSEKEVEERIELLKTLERASYAGLYQSDHAVETVEKVKNLIENGS